jgi:RNA polymerase-binding transcription factor DksA
MINMDLNAQKRALVKLRREYAQILLDVRGRLHDVSQSDDDPVTSDVPTHDADVGTALFERERDMAFEQEYVDTLAMIDAALSRIDDGTYTRCARCGNPVGEERQMALPYAILCIRDQELEERM